MERMGRWGEKGKALLHDADWVEKLPFRLAQRFKCLSVLSFALLYPTAPSVPFFSEIGLKGRHAPHSL